MEREEGVVASFDEHKGWGTLRSRRGREFSFHCTAIADGTRRIAVGIDVTFEIVAGHLGRWEAADVTPAGAPRPPSPPR